MRLTAILALSLLLAGGCASSRPTAAGSAATDWSRVTPSANGAQIVAWKTLARHCDAWYKGAQPQIDFRYADGYAAVDAGHKVRTRAEDFAGIVRSARVPGAKVEAFASLSEVYSNGREGIPQDKFGLKARYRYRATALSDDALRYHIIEKPEGGM